MGLGNSIASLFGSSAPPPAPISEQMMTAIAVSQKHIDLYLAPLNAACREFDIVTTPRVAAFLATVAWESEDFKYTREIWGPSAAQQRYEGRLDLGNTVRGDGWKFRGAGLIELTGRANFAECSAALLGDPSALLNNPELLSQPELACRSAGWFWFRHGCNELADTLDMVAVTRRVNGGTNGLQGRLALYKTLINL